jgi:repressor LexA
MSSVVKLRNPAAGELGNVGRQRAAVGDRIFSSKQKEVGSRVAEYTKKQGQYLAFIYYYTKIHRRPPAEADMQRYFRVTPPTVHQMVLRLEEKGLITREPGKARTIRVVLPAEELPGLE